MAVAVAYGARRGVTVAVAVAVVVLWLWLRNTAHGTQHTAYSRARRVIGR